MIKSVYTVFIYFMKNFKFYNIIFGYVLVMFLNQKNLTPKSLYLCVLQRQVG
jgi:hypothetical protein